MVIDVISLYASRGCVCFVLPCCRSLRVFAGNLALKRPHMEGLWPGGSGWSHAVVCFVSVPTWATGQLGGRTAQEGPVDSHSSGALNLLEVAQALLSVQCCLPGIVPCRTLLLLLVQAQHTQNACVWLSSELSPTLLLTWFLQTLQGTL